MQVAGPGVKVSTPENQGTVRRAAHGVARERDGWRRWSRPCNVLRPARVTPTSGQDRKAAIVKMNRFERLFGFRGEAKVKYLDGEFQVVSPGDYVVCAVTGEPIPLAELRYWSVELQEPYATADASLRRHLETRRPRGGR